ncbi:MAG TPA: HisA/HisF-related TIM barrel protein [Gaiellaceae bacterium]|nr:HisA/HisF-related TIM barrel protein [Gaiellaceae bacterium]
MIQDTASWFSGLIEVIPAVDVLGTEAVRLRRGDYGNVVESPGDPADLARRWRDTGAHRIHLVDLDGARSGRVRPELVRQVVAACAPLPVQASGGVRTPADADVLIRAGADRIVVGTAAWPDPAPWVEALGEALVVAVDVRDGRLRTAGWTSGDGLAVDDALRRAQRAGVRRCLVTAIERDGTLDGPDLELVARAAATGIAVLAAGGVRMPADVAALAGAGAEAAVVGRALL